MRLVRLDSIREEMALARDIPSAVLGSLPPLRRGVRLSPSLAARLAGRGVRAVWVEEGLGGSDTHQFARLAAVDPERPERPLVRYHDESGRVRETVMAVLDGVGSDPDGPASGPAGSELPAPAPPADEVDAARPTGGSSRELDRTATR